MSSQAELEESELQLVQINQALKDSPDDSELLALKAELESLIQLTKDYLKSQGHASGSGSRASTSAAGGAAGGGGGATSTSSGAGGSSSSSTANFTTGTTILAKWHKDGKFYSARIASVSGSVADPVYTVIFDIDKSTEVVRKGDVKAMSESKKRGMQYMDSDGTASDGGAGGSAGKKAKAGAAAEKVEKKAQKEEDRKARVAEQNNRQSSWQSFAKKSTKKGVHIPGVKGESMFKSPDNPYGRGSGKGMTTYAQKQRVKFTGEDGAEQ